MNIVQDIELREATAQWVAALDVLRSEMPASESRSQIREVFAAFLLLRWTDLQDAEQEAMAVFEDRPYRPLLPEPLQWRHWVRLDHAHAITERLHELEKYVEKLRGDAENPVATYLHAVADPLRSVLKVNVFYLHDFVRWVAELPFETPSQRRALLDMFDQVIAETSDPYDSQHATQANIARLVAALANPQPGERVYDPCFGSGNFLVAAWQQAERSRNEHRRPGALLEVAGIEMHASAFQVGLTRMLLAGIETPRLELGNSLERESLSSPSREGFDVVLANPPIGVKTSQEPWRYQQFAILTSDSTGLFVQHALSQLKPNGRAVIAVPEGFLFRGGADRELRQHLLEQGQVEAVIGLPAGALTPYAGVKGSLLVLNKQGGASHVRMVDATTMFELRSGRKAPVIRAVIAQQLADELRRPELRKPRELPPGMPESTPGTGLLARSMWELSIEDLAAAEWDLSPRRREKGGLDDLLAGLKEALGETGTVTALSSVAQIMAGKSIKAVDLLDEEPLDRAVPYVRIKDLAQGKVGRASNWLRPELASLEQRRTLLSGDVLVSKSGTIGKTALVRNGAIGAIPANGLYVLRADQERLDAGFLLAYLASPACQKWLAAQSRGTVIQHVNRDVLDNLPVPLPPLQLQARAAAQFREFGTDVLTFLGQAAGSSESDRVSAWLSEVGNKIPTFNAGLDATPSLIQIEPLVAMAKDARRWLDHEEISPTVARWLPSLTEALLPLSGVAKIPPGPSLLNVLQDGVRSLQEVLEITTGHLPADSQARTIAERLRDWLRETISDLMDAGELHVRMAPASLVAGSFGEFAIELENPGVLPLRSVRVETSPDWGITDVPYLVERGAFTVNLRGDVPKRGAQLSLRLHWQARNLNGQAVGGEIELAIALTDPKADGLASGAALGGSPYVTGSPLAPQSGHDVFFGRDDLIQQISRQIASHGNVVLLEGNRRAGKTSVLRHLEGRTAIPGWLAVYSSLQSAEGASQGTGVPTHEVFRSIAAELAKGVASLGLVTMLPDGTDLDHEVLFSQNKASKLKEMKRFRESFRTGISEGSAFADFRDYLEVLLSLVEPLGLGLVLMLDEFDKLQEGIDNGVTSPQVPENIRFLIQTYPRFSAILTGSRRLKRLREEYWSALYGLGSTIAVTALDVESARNVVTMPVQGRLIFSKEAVDHLIEVTARQAFLMQCICNEIFGYADRTKTRSITLSIVKDATQNWVRNNTHFGSLWDYSAQGPKTGRLRRQLILFICAQNFKQDVHVDFGALHEQLAQAGVVVDDEPLDADLAYLRELELIDFRGEFGDSQYRLAIPMMADWIEQQQDFDVVASRAQVESEEENG